MRNVALENVIEECFETVTRHSWTWGRLTDEERKRFLDVDFSCIKGNANQRREAYYTAYSAFLHALGYKPIGWREPDEAPAF